jgi:FkbM family methyltransferase
MIKNFSCRVHGFDPTPKSIAMIKVLNPPELFILHEFGLAAKDGSLNLYVPLNSNHVSCSCVDNFGTNSMMVDVRSIESIVRDNNLKQIDVLKMDIEGAEYEIIDSIQSVSVPIHQILIEFHHFYPQVDSSLTKEAIRKLNNFGYKIFSIEGYNYSFIKDNSGVSI